MVSVAVLGQGGAAYLFPKTDLVGESLVFFCGSPF